MPRMENIPFRVPGNCFGVIFQTREKSDQLEYFAAVQVTEEFDSTNDIPTGMQSFDVAANQYAVRLR